MGICCTAQETQSGALYQPRGVDGESDGRAFQKEGDICIPMADSCWGLTENNEVLSSNYHSIKFFLEIHLGR